MDSFDAINPLDYRYYGRDKESFEKIAPYLSENSRIKYLTRVEIAIIKTLSDMNICSKKVLEEVQRACDEVTAQEVYEEEDRIKHDIRALVNTIRNKVSTESKPFVHLGATSFDIINTADSLRFKEFTKNVLLPKLAELLRTLIDTARRESKTLQIGRTHGQHAEPITFGFAIAEYVDRLGNRLVEINRSIENLRGKMSGAVGAYNSAFLFFDDPEQYERDVLNNLGLKPALHSTQIVQPEYVTDFFHSIISCFGVLANLADDMRNLQRSEIGEVGESFDSKQVGSSTMPQKRNPINFENVKSLWKTYAPRMTTVYMDQISDHQRDLTNSASGRFLPEILAALFVSVQRMNSVMKKLAVDRNNMKRNFDMSKNMLIAEPLYILLAYKGHKDAHEAVRKLTLKSQQTGRPLFELALDDESTKSFISGLEPEQVRILREPENYTGIASKKTEAVCDFWSAKIIGLSF